MQNRTVSAVLVLVLLLLLLLFPFLLNQKPGYVVVQLSNHLLSEPHQFSFRNCFWEGKKDHQQFPISSSFCCCCCCCHFFAFVWDFWQSEASLHCAHHHHPLVLLLNRVVKAQSRLLGIQLVDLQLLAFLLAYFQIWEVSFSGKNEFGKHGWWWFLLLLLRSSYSCMEELERKLEEEEEARLRMMMSIDCCCWSIKDLEGRRKNLW